MLIKIIKKYFWLFNILTAVFLSIISSGFIKNLYFRMEDFGNIYFYLNGGNRPWPHYALKYILLIPHLLFSDQPTGHFILVLIMYILLSLSISFYVWELTKNKMASFVSVIIFSSGWIGSEMLFMVETGWYSLYYILSLLSIISYNRYSNTKKISYYIGSLSIFTLLVVAMPFRAFSLFALILLTHLYTLSQIALKNKIKTITLSIKHLSPFLIINFLAYNYLPKFFGESLSSFGIHLQYDFRYFPNLLSDFGNLVFPSTFQNTTISKIIGVILILLLLELALFAKTSLWLKKTITYLSACLVISYIVFHIKEYNVVHPSWSRYLMSPYPFYVFIASLMITTLIKKHYLRFKLVGLGLLLTLVSANLIAGFYSPLKEKLLTRSEYLKKFNNDIKQFIPSLNKDGKYLFYFDVTTDDKSQNTFNSFLESGIYPHEFILADLFRIKSENIKLARDYNEFANELNNSSYTNRFTFFYNKDEQLINTTSTFFSESSYQLKRKTLEYSSKIIPDTNESKSTNDLLKIGVNDFPSVRPIKLTFKIRARSLVSNINKFPYQDGSLYEHPSNNIESLLKFIKERNDLKRKLKISSSGSEYPDIVEDVVDSNDNTTWRSSKKKWRDGEPAWIEIEFQKEVPLKEIRWISRREGNLPVSYEYQVFSKETDNWKSIHAVKDKKVKANEYIVDNFSSTITKKLMMLITKTNGDFPAISEIEFLSNSYDVPSEQANFILEHPFTEVKNKQELTKIFNTVSDQLKISIYPISDKYSDKNHSSPVTQNIILDNKERHYSFILPPGGTKLTDLLIEFPSIPLSANISNISLTTLEK